MNEKSNNDSWIPMPRYKLRKALVKNYLKKENLTGKTCLELGYGAGDMLLLYKSMGLETYGYDFSDIAFNSAKARIERAGEKDNIKLFKQESDFKGTKYDYLFAFEILEHIKDDGDAIKEWSELLNDNSMIILSVPAKMSKWGPSDEAVGHYKRYEKIELKQLLLDSGFSDIKIISYGFPLHYALDYMVNRSYSLDNNDSNKEELSKKSGVIRKKSPLVRVLSSDAILFPFYYIQLLFQNLDLSSYYIAIAKRENP